MLVLNRLWQAVNVIGARRAFALLAREHAQVVHQTEEAFRTYSLLDWIDFSTYNPPVDALETVHTINRNIRLPRVILLTFFDKLHCKELKLTRNNVFERDGEKFQRFYGMSSRTAMEKYSGGVALYRAAEAISLTDELPAKTRGALRKLVEQARKDGQTQDQRRQSQEATYRFMSAMAGCLEGFEEAARALFAADRLRFEALLAPWPPDIQTHLLQLAQAAWLPSDPPSSSELPHA